LNVVVTVDHASFATFEAASYWYGNTEDEYGPAVIAGDSSTTEGFIQ